MAMIASSSQYEIVHALRHALECHEAARRPEIPAFSTGSSSLDRLLPEAGLPRGALVEYLAGLGSGATALALIAATKACSRSVRWW